MAEALLGTVIENLPSFVQDELTMFWGVGQQTHKLCTNLTAIRAVLKDAEKKQVTGHVLKDWLQKLTNAAYVLDDILDECSIQSKRVHSDEHNSCLLAHVHLKNILFHYCIGKRMKDITKRFQDINEERRMFELRTSVTEKQGEDECGMGQNHNLNTLEAMRKKVQQMGTKGATILVTTRLEQVASIMETHPAYRLIKLSQDYSWSLFKHHAFGPNREEREEIVAIGKEIVRKCVGSPLAIKTLGSLLCDEIEVTQWQNIKGSEFWNIREESSITGNLEVEDVGNKVRRKLYNRSFFQEAKLDGLGIITSFKMHDLFHDLARSIMGEECVVHDHIRKLNPCGTFLDFGFKLGHNHWLPSIHCLRALRTSSSLLSPLKDLTYLRYLNLHGNSVTSLPNFICGLKKLQILKLEYFGSHNLLPKDLTPLQDLRHLVIYRCPSIADMPLNIGMLSHLRTLSTFIVDSKSGYGLDAKQSNFISKKKLNR
ncbi:Disease resistance protein RGA2 [Glycine soja]|uniref:Disease resistance protein RGA2 n=1 Tax=Glycine soja TaxID=3848 RepID=A0A445M3G2_GLYSO|nr:Disease resistance protein RGA2 [Glycine soja]